VHEPRQTAETDRRQATAQRRRTRSSASTDEQVAPAGARPETGDPAVGSAPGGPLRDSHAAGTDCPTFLQWALPHLQLDWRGFQRVRRQVCRRIGRRLAELGLGNLEEYRAFLEAQPQEWRVMDSFCRISVSRLMRDRIVFEKLGHVILPSLADAALERKASELRCWSAGCASGEEPYTVALLWRFELAGKYPGVDVHIVATDVDRNLLERAAQGRYRRSSLREVPSSWIAEAFTRHGDWLELRDEFRHGVEFSLQDIRERVPAGEFDVILCRNVAFTYFDAALQRRVVERLLTALRPGGALVIGLRERLPEGVEGVTPWKPELGIYRKSESPQLDFGLRAPPGRPAEYTAA
jgi:chemotaxis protein methyltransferase CheR